MQKHITSFDNVKINYDLTRLSDEFLVFLHGAGGDLNAWKKERRFFHKKGISTLAIDLRGHGLSGRPDSVKDYMLENFARDIKQIIEKEKISNPVLIGHCFGGVVTMVFHKLYPHIANSYILIDTTYKAPQRLKDFFGHHPFLMHTLNAVLEHEKLRNEHFSHVNFDKFVGVKEWDLKLIFSDIMHTSFRSWLFTYENLANFEGISILKSINKPVLIIEGREDTIFDILVARKIKNLVKTSKLDIIPLANHIIVVNNPNALEKEIFKFVSSLHNLKKIK